MVRDFRDSLPRPRRLVLSEAPLDELHEDRAICRPRVGAERFTADDNEDTRTIFLDWQFEFCVATGAEERHDALRIGRELEWTIGIGLEDLTKGVDRSHDS